MIPKCWLPLSLLAFATALAAACSPKFTACETNTCKVRGAGGEIGDGGSSGEVGRDASAGGKSSLPGDSTVEGGAGGETESVEPTLATPCSVARQLACNGHATAPRLPPDRPRRIAAPPCAAGPLCHSPSGQRPQVVPHCADVAF